ncbi:MAG: hypothetical protein OXR73_24315 [Myxococcales bacterium]|nr:hypothetical protein [Myxococcales bacterium]
MPTPKRLGLRLTGALLLCAALSGCELIVDFDRSKIGEQDRDSRPADQPDAGLDPQDQDEDSGVDSDEDAGR